MKRAINTVPQFVFLLAWMLILASLYLTSVYNYLLFHSLVEIFSIIVACGIFMLAWNSQRFLDNNYLLFIGIAYLFVALLDLLHTLAYKGMGVFSNDANLATQLWIAARYLQSISLLIAPLFLHKTLKPYAVFFSYVVVFGLLLGAIFYWGVFPDCYIEGVGQTPFKKISEYIISLILVGAIILLLRYRDDFDRNVLQLLVGAIVFTIGSELFFTFYVNVYSLSNFIGHIFKLISFYLIYKAIIETGLVKPYTLLFRQLKQSEETLRDYTLELQARNEELDTFAHTVAHDLKSPISNIIILWGLLQETNVNSLNREQKGLLISIKETAYKMNSIINELLLLAEVRKADVDVEPLNMEVIVREAHNRLAPMINETQTQIIFPEVWPKAWGYAPWIEEVWVNYMNNALKYGADAQLLELGATVQPDNQVCFWIRDYGVGLTAEEQSQLFTSFTRLNKLHITGHGLGLAIVKRIVEKLDGQVGVESDGPGQGSKFLFTLPIMHN